MKKLATVLGMAVLVFSANTGMAEVEIKRTALEWQEVAYMDGAGVYNRLCAVCHGASGKGDGPAVSALRNEVPDLTSLSANNDGVYPYRHVERSIFGEHRTITLGTVDMPPWGEQFTYAGPGTVPRRAFARKQVRSLTAHIESLQVE